MGTVAENGNGCGNGCEKIDVFFLDFLPNSPYLCIVKSQKSKNDSTSLHIFRQTTVREINNISITIKT